ncbi:acetate kinase [Natronospirillum operosum]|uniref:Acetate kinase n=1 Tax=Natronospirillum operosum TaxID=2759953 RepID=A0A4Z0WIQ4_9GAMM|nr:acetate kinase [Natronospirillum operosum]TGG95015.1 acetate kinase [Natronospirillum operosum]
MTASLILVINSGSSSLKFSVFDSTQQTEPVSGLAERLDTPDATLKVSTQVGTRQTAIPDADHQQALRAVTDMLAAEGFGPDRLLAAGHRVVHGGETFSSSVQVTADILAQIEALNHLAPLHNPANMEGIRALSTLFPDLPQVAVFDTAFHQSVPPAAYTYAVPHALYRDHGVRRYGFHGSSHRYVSSEAVRLLQLDPADHRVITAHLGNGCSACAVKNGQSLDTTMGLTPLEGLVMGTRSGDVDPSLHQFISERTNLDLDGVTAMLNRESGLLGISELSNDMRTLIEAAEEGHAQAELAIEVFCYRLAKAIAGLLTATGGLDALVFTGGIGENATPIRERTVYHLGWLGLNLDVTANLTHGRDQMGIISTTHEPAVMVIPTREEWMIAQDTLTLVSAH